MTEIKLFDKPQFHDAEFYSGLGLADHINQRGHRERLLLTLFEVGRLIIKEGVKTIADWGAGNGGLLSEVKKLFPAIVSFGYDLLPANVEHAREVLGVDVTLVDFTKDECAVGDLVIVSEVLEHLVDPHGLLRKFYANEKVKWVIASSPATETVEAHWPYHLYIWDLEGYAVMFSGAGWGVFKHFAWGGGQFVVAGRGEHEDPNLPPLAQRAKRLVADMPRRTGGRLPDTADFLEAFRDELSPKLDKRR